MHPVQQAVIIPLLLLLAKTITLPFICLEANLNCISFCIFKRRAFIIASWKFWLTLHSVHQCHLTTAKCLVQLHSQVSYVHKLLLLLVQCLLILSLFIPPEKWFQSKVFATYISLLLKMQVESFNWLCIKVISQLLSHCCCFWQKQ